MILLNTLMVWPLKRFYLFLTQSPAGLARMAVLPSIIFDLIPKFCLRQCFDKPADKQKVEEVKVANVAPRSMSFPQIFEPIYIHTSADDARLEVFESCCDWPRTRHPIHGKTTFNLYRFFLCCGGSIRFLISNRIIQRNLQIPIRYIFLSFQELIIKNEVDPSLSQLDIKTKHNRLRNTNRKSRICRTI